MDMKKYLWIGTVCLLAVAILIILFYNADPASKYSSSNTPIDVLIEENADYARARTLVRAGNSAEAEKAYNAALITATDSVQQGQIKFGIAQTKDYQGDYVGAVRMKKSLLTIPTTFLFYARMQCSGWSTSTTKVFQRLQKKFLAPRPTRKWWSPEML